MLVYFHGGAFFLGSLETHDHVARNLAKETGHTVVSVDYRRAPEAAFPAGLDDCYAVLRWVAEHGESIGWNGKNLAIAGDSSGGTFVAALAARAHDDGLDALTHQILFYPSLDLDFDVERYASMKENATGYGLETAGLLPFNSFYLDSGADPEDPRVSPIKRADLSGLAPALVITAEFDPLRDEGELYAKRLAEAGVPTTGQPLCGGQPRIRAELLLDPGIPPGLCGDGRIPEPGLSPRKGREPTSGRRKAAARTTWFVPPLCAPEQPHRR